MQDVVINSIEDQLEEVGSYEDNKFLTFQLGTEVYGIEIIHVKEIIGIQKVTEIPDMPNHVKGVINLRGQVFPVIDVRLLFEMQEREYDERTCIIVVNYQNITTGLVVDEVSEVLDILSENIEPSPRINAKSSRRFVKGLGKIGNQVTILLSIDQLLFNDDQEY